jgi:putative methyltransferase (TIGR04325 family)
MNCVNFIKLFIPKIFIYFAGRILHRVVVWQGPFNSWKEADVYAQKIFGNYSNNSILKKVIKAANIAKKKRGSYERDGCVISSLEYGFHIISIIFYHYYNNKKKNYKVLDVGGSLGSTFYQNKKFLFLLKKLSWSVLEQKNFAEYGNLNLNEPKLNFFSNIDKALLKKYDLIIMSGSLQYLENYKEIFEKLIKSKPKYIILDRTIESANNEKTKIFVQINPKKLIESSYPVRIFNQKDLFLPLKYNYELIANIFEDTIRNLNVLGYSKCYIFKLK